jgi:hypothetical protein
VVGTIDGSTLGTGIGRFDGFALDGFALGDAVGGSVEGSFELLRVGTLELGLLSSVSNDTGDAIGAMIGAVVGGSTFVGPVSSGI